MAYIINNILESGKSVQLGAEELVRSLSFGNNWTRIRILLRCRIQGEGALDNACFLSVGLCKGTERTFSKPNTENFAGAYLSGSAGIQWYWASATYGIYLGTAYSPGSGIKKSGVNYVVQGSFGGNTVYMASRGSPYAGLLAVDLYRKYGGSYEVGLLMPNTAATINNSSDEIFNIVLEDDYKSRADDYLPANLSTDITSVEDNMDTLSVFWSACTPTFEIDRVSVIRYQ